jgi:hypothetical protein
MVNPIPAFTTAAGTALVIGLLTGAANTVGVFQVPDCDDFTSWLTGCDDTFSTILAYGILGTIPGAHAAVNAFMAIIGLSMRSTVAWSIVRLARGGG